MFSFNACSTGMTLIWANESYLLAVKNAYGNLPPFDKNYKYRDKKGVEHLGGYRLDQNYYDLNAPVVDQQPMRAGVRLAKYLNDTFDPPKTDTGDLMSQINTNMIQSGVSHALAGMYCFFSRSIATT